MPGVLFLAAGVIGWTVIGPRPATGLVAVAGGVTGLVVSWIVVSLVLMHFWVLVATVFAVQRRTWLQRKEKWKLLGAGLALLAVYSPLIAAVIVRMFATG